MRVLVCGGRDYSEDKAGLWDTLDSLNAWRGVEVVIEGGARGADHIGRRWAESRGVPVEEYRADWKAYGNRAGPMRNLRMFSRGKPGHRGCGAGRARDGAHGQRRARRRAGQSIILKRDSGAG